ncbi:MAG: TIGR02186 family protein [Hyphomicrobiaceae bacterium]
MLTCNQARYGLATMTVLLSSVLVASMVLADDRLAQGQQGWPQPFPPQQQFPLPQGQGQGQPHYQPQQPQYQQPMPQQGFPAAGGQGFGAMQPVPQQAPQQMQIQQAPQQWSPAQQPQQLPIQPVQQPATPAPAPTQSVQPTGMPPASAASAPAHPSPTSGAATPDDASRPKERVEADVSTRSVAITSSFTGTEIIIFGSVENSRQETAESGLYDVAIVIEGATAPIVARKKDRVAGLWINTAAQTFTDVPSYYAIASTRPVSEIAEPHVLVANEIGFEHVRMNAVKGDKSPPASELQSFKDAVIRRKQADKLYQKSDYGVAFIGRSLFRSTLSLPANVPVGPLKTTVYLFKDRQLLSKHVANVSMQREGIEALMHNFAFKYPLWYGIAAVLIAVAAGLIASALFKKGSH